MGFPGFVVAFAVVIILMVIPLVGVWALNLETWFGIGFPVIAIIVFLAGIAYRVIKWAQLPVPFRIPTTCGQEKSLPWIQTNCIDNPTNNLTVIIRMAFEVLTFRSLFRNTALDFREGRAYYSSSKWLWLFALAFHYCFLVVVLRHLRLFTDPVPFFVTMLENVDGFMEIGLFPFTWLPGLYLSGVGLLGAATLLFLRRIVMPQVRYISLLNDWFPLLLIIHIAATGILMRYILKVDIVAVKQVTMNIATFHWGSGVPEGIGVLFYIHVFLVSVLLAYFPFSKLMHAPGVFLSPTRNMANNSRAKRHINPWNPKVHTHDYYEYEDEFREVMVEAGLPVDKPLEPKAEEGAEDGAA